MRFFSVLAAVTSVCALPLPAPLRQTASLAKREAQVVTEYAPAVTVTNVVLAYPDGRLVTITTEVVAQETTSAVVVPETTSAIAVPETTSAAVVVPETTSKAAGLYSVIGAALSSVNAAPTTDSALLPPTETATEPSSVFVSYAPAPIISTETTGNFAPTFGTVATSVQVPETTVATPTPETTVATPTPETTVVTTPEAVIPSSTSTQDNKPTDTPPTGGGSDEYSGEATYYSPSVGLTSCGTLHADSEMVAALSFTQYGSDANPNNSPVCGTCAVVHSNGKSVKVKIVDKCPSCSYGSLDLSPAAFQSLADLSVGRIPISWSYVAC